MADDKTGHAASGIGPVDQRQDEGVTEGAPHPVGTVPAAEVADVATGPLAANRPSPVGASSAGTTSAKATGMTEWTASDARGPLNEAPPLPADAPSSDLSTPKEERPEASTSAEARTTPIKSSSADASSADDRPVSVAQAAGGRSGVPIAIGLVIGALIGAGSAYLVYQAQPNQSADLGSKVAQISGRVDALDGRPDPQQAIAALKASVAALSSKVASLPPPASPAPTPTAAPAGGPSAADMSALQDKLAGLQTAMDTLQKQVVDAKAVDGKVGALQSSLAEIGKQASGAQAGVSAIQGQQKTFEGRLSAPALAVVADSLVQQIDQGQPYAQQVDALEALGADPARVAVLRESARKGVPSAKSLAAQFKPLAEPILATGHSVAPNAGLFDRLKSGMSGMVSIRSTSDTTGDDLASRVSRIEADLTHGDVTGAVGTWNALPAAARAKSEAWGALAKTSADAIEAARALQQGAIAALGRKS